MNHYQCNDCGEIHERIRGARECCFGSYSILNEDYESSVARSRPHRGIPVDDLPLDELMNLRASEGDYEASMWVYRNLK